MDYLKSGAYLDIVGVDLVGCWITIFSLKGLVNDVQDDDTCMFYRLDE